MVGIYSYSYSKLDNGRVAIYHVRKNDLICYLQRILKLYEEKPRESLNYGECFFSFSGSTLTLPLMDARGYKVEIKTGQTIFPELLLESQVSATLVFCTSVIRMLDILSTDKVIMIFDGNTYELRIDTKDDDGLNTENGTYQTLKCSGYGDY